MRIVELRYIVEVLYIGGFGDRNTDRQAFGIKPWKRAKRNAKKYGGDWLGRFVNRDDAETYAKSSDVCLGWGEYQIVEIEVPSHPEETHES